MYMPAPEPDDELAFDHERVEITTGARSGLTIVCAVHSTTLGPALGGCRVWSYPSWTDALQDALRLSRGMTSKNALAGLHNGGGKAVIRLAPGETLASDRRRAAFLDLGDAVEALGGSYRTAEDVGTAAADMAVVAERTAHVVGLPTDVGGHGDPGRYTARGVYSALRETLRRTTGSPDPRDRRISIAGLGQVGAHLARQLRAEGAILTLSDIDDRKRALAEELGAQWADPAEIHTVEVDVFMPAGVGGMLSDRVIDELGAAAVVGPANNQLAHVSGATRLAQRGILYAPDYLVSAGGVIHLGSEVPLEERLVAIDAIAETLARVFDEAERERVTTVEAADRLVVDRLSGH